MKAHLLLITGGWKWKATVLSGVIMAIFTVSTKFLKVGVCTHGVKHKFEAKRMCLAEEHGQYFTQSLVLVMYIPGFIDSSHLGQTKICSCLP